MHPDVSQIRVFKCFSYDWRRLISHHTCFHVTRRKVLQSSAADFILIPSGVPPTPDVGPAFSAPGF